LAQIYSVSFLYSISSYSSQRKNHVIIIVFFLKKTKQEKNSIIKTKGKKTIKNNVIKLDELTIEGRHVSVALMKITKLKKISWWRSSLSIY
jgi:hypothetical protein